MLRVCVSSDVGLVDDDMSTSTFGGEDEDEGDESVCPLGAASSSSGTQAISGPRMFPTAFAAVNDGDSDEEDMTALLSGLWPIKRRPLSSTQGGGASSSSARSCTPPDAWEEYDPWS